MKTKTFLLIVSMLLGVARAQDKKADRLFNQWNYYKASNVYQKKINRKPSAYLYYKLGVCYRQMGSYPKEEESAFGKVNSFGNYSDPDFYLIYAQSLRTNGKTQEAKNAIEKFILLKPEDPRGDFYKNAFEIMGNDCLTDQPITIKNLGKVNSIGADFNPVKYKNQIIFTSSRKTQGHSKTYGWTGSHFLDLYQADIGKDENRLENMRAFEVKGINKKFHDGPICFSKNYDTLFLSRVEKYLKGTDKESLNIERNKIFMSVFKNNEWQKEVPFYLNSDYYSVANPFLSPDGKRLYFVSDKAGGFGETDIYYCEKNDGGWGEPINMGPKINTFNHESFPTMDSKGNFYFASEGYYGPGGMDICVAKFIDGDFEKANPLKAPINSAYDDFGILFLTEEKTGYISSNRINTSRGSDDIYHYSLLDDKVNKDLLLSDYIVGWKPKLPEPEIVKIEPEIIEKIEEIKENFNAFPYKPFELTIYFDFDKSFIRNDDFDQLDSLADLMKKYPESTLTLTGHTDSHGPNDYNYVLSDKRDNSVIFFLKEQGIDTKRISAKGYGFTRLVNRCKKGVKCSDDEDQMNRRVEIILHQTKAIQQFKNQ
jgi:hypothetical protein